MKSIVKDHDYVILDEFCENSFFEGAYATTKNVFIYRHLDEKHIEEIIADIRSKDTENGIMVVT
jgi:glycine C-acetyltransferase/8-amino-7-oxononanoate synthase